MKTNNPKGLLIWENSIWKSWLNVNCLYTCNFSRNWSKPGRLESRSLLFICNPVNIYAFSVINWNSRFSDQKRENDYDCVRRPCVLFWKRISRHFSNVPRKFRNLKGGCGSCSVSFGRTVVTPRNVLPPRRRPLLRLGLRLSFSSLASAVAVYYFRVGLWCTRARRRGGDWRTLVTAVYNWYYNNTYLVYIPCR